MRCSELIEGGNCVLFTVISYFWTQHVVAECLVSEVMNIQNDEQCMSGTPQHRARWGVEAPQMLGLSFSCEVWLFIDSAIGCPLQSNYSKARPLSITQMGSRND